MGKKINRKLIEVEIRLGFLYIPAKDIDQMPDNNTQISVLLDEQSRKLTYNATYKRIFGLKLRSGVKSLILTNEQCKVSKRNG